jgi:hypothetical protein
MNFIFSSLNFKKFVFHPYSIEMLHFMSSYFKKLSFFIPKLFKKILFFSSLFLPPKLLEKNPFKKLKDEKLTF